MKYAITIDYDALHATPQGKPIGAIRVVAPEEVDLSRHAGYALGSTRWVRLGETVVVRPGEFITYRRNHGSNRHPDVRYHAVEVMPDGTTRPVSDDEVALAVAALGDAEKIARAKNSSAYALAVYITSRGGRREQLMSAEDVLQRVHALLQDGQCQEALALVQNFVGDNKKAAPSSHQ